MTAAQWYMKLNKFDFPAKEQDVDPIDGPHSVMTSQIKKEYGYKNLHGSKIHTKESPLSSFAVRGVLSSDLQASLL